MCSGSQLLVKVSCLEEERREVTCLVGFILSYLCLILYLHSARISELKWEHLANYLLLILCGAKY